jgi:hypothetical protein
MNKFPWRGGVLLGTAAVLLSLLAGGCQTGSLGGTAASNRSVLDPPGSSSFDSRRDSERNYGGGAQPCRFG